MKPSRFEYVAPSDLDGALQALAEAPGEARPLAGGQSLVPMLNFRLAAPERLVDLNRVSELAFIEEGGDGGLSLGAMTRQRTLERDERVVRLAPLLAEGIPWIAHPQIRARGTIGGSVAHGDPAAELPALLLTSGARVRLARAARAEEAGSRVERELDVESLYLGPFFTVLEPEEILVSIEVPPPEPHEAVAFDEIARRRGDYAIAGAAARVRLAPDGTCAEVALSLVNATPAPVLSRAAAERLLGETVTPRAIEDAAEAVAAEAQPSADLHASEAYRRHLVRVLARRVLGRACGRARETLA